MATVNEALQIALDHFYAGRFIEAETLAARILAAIPDHADAAHLYGLVLAQTGRAQEAVGYLATAATVRDTPDHHVNYGLVLAMNGRRDEAMAAFRRALALNPGHAASGRGLAELLLDRGRRFCMADEYARAVDDLREASAHNPLHAEIALWLGTALHECGRIDLASVAYRRALVLAPTMNPAWINLATLTADDPMAGDVAVLWRRAVVSRLPAVDERDRRGLADALTVQGAPGAATACRAALAVNPADAALWTNLGTLGGEEAEACFYRGVKLDPRNAAAYLGLSTIARERGLLDDALRKARKALLFAPQTPEIRMAYALAALSSGRLAEGWAHYDDRWSVETEKASGGRPVFAAPRWNGEALNGELLVWGEQGLGGEIMLASLLPDLQARGCRSVVWASVRLHSLLARSMPELRLLRRPGDDPRQMNAAAEIAMGDLPQLLRRNLADFPTNRGPFLRAEAGRTAEFRRFCDQGTGALLVGVSWRSGNARFGATRSVEFARLAAALSRCGGDRPIRLFNLQYGDIGDDIAAARAVGCDVSVIPDLDTTNDIDGLAALICAMDLVVTIDNVTAHLAGALGAPCWTLLPFAAEWRWLRDRADSPWHPGMRLFRQARLGDWDGVLQDVATNLRALSAGDEAVLRPAVIGASAPVDETALSAQESAREKDKYRHMWRLDAYRTVSPGALQSAQFDLPGLLRRYGARTALDAGCGSGKTSIHVMENGGGYCRMYGFDIADNCLEPYFDAIKSDYLTVGCLWRREDFRDVYDAVICTDVLEHIPTDRVRAVLSNLRAVCRKVSFLGIALFDDYFGPAELGEPLHLTVKPPEWWLERIAGAGFRVLRHEMLEHPSVGPAWLVVEAVPGDGV
jgi:tetratricopeptide (TPR) repeat protein/SAM-dependent methyltransferase